MTQENLLDRYNCGPVKFSGADNALYERHLTFDHVIEVGAATPRDRFEAVAHSIRDVLSQRWLKTEQTCEERNAKRVYTASSSNPCATAGSTNSQILNIAASGKFSSDRTIADYAKEIWQVAPCLVD